MVTLPVSLIFFSVSACATPTNAAPRARTSNAFFIVAPACSDSKADSREARPVSRPTGRADHERLLCRVGSITHLEVLHGLHMQVSCLPGGGVRQEIPERLR